MINRDKKYPLRIKSMAGEGVYQRILKEDAGWEYLNFEARIMKKGEQWEGNTGNNEYGIILLGGNYKVKTDQDHPACFKTPDEAAIEIRGGDNATRQINSLLQPGFNCHRRVSESESVEKAWENYMEQKKNQRHFL